jgi:urease accessory protein
VTRVTLGRGARLLLREELLLGRHGELPGSVRQRVRVCLAGEPLYDQELAVGPGACGWPGPAITGGRRAVGSLLLVEPRLPPMCDSPRPSPGFASMPLSGPGLLLTALDHDGLTLHRRLDLALAEVASVLEAR